MLQELSEFISKYWALGGAILFFLSIFVEVSKININPWSALGNSITKTLRDDMNKRFETFQQKQDEYNAQTQEQISSLKAWNVKENSVLEVLSKEITNNQKNLLEIIETNRKEAEKNDDVKEAYRLRWEVLDFADRCKNNSPVTENQFKHIFNEHDRYIAYVRKYEIDNGLEAAEFEYIKQLYNEKYYEKVKENKEE